MPYPGCFTPGTGTTRWVECICYLVQNFDFGAGCGNEGFFFLFFLIFASIFQDGFLKFSLHSV
jgi:hypothetical protein